MAFLRRENKKSGTYLSICESYRDDHGKGQSRVLRHIAMPLIIVMMILHVLAANL